MIIIYTSNKILPYLLCKSNSLVSLIKVWLLEAIKWLVNDPLNNCFKFLCFDQIVKLFRMHSLGLWLFLYCVQNFTHDGFFQPFSCFFKGIFIPILIHIFGRKFQIYSQNFPQCFNFLILWESLSKWAILTIY